MSYWAYGAAALAGLVPIAHRAAIGAVLGAPFGIETLMTLAALGAVLIGAAEEAAVVDLLVRRRRVLGEPCRDAIPSGY